MTTTDNQTMRNGFQADGPAALAHALMLGSDEGDVIILAASSPEALKKAHADLIGGQFKPAEVSRIAVYDAGLVPHITINAYARS